MYVNKYNAHYWQPQEANANLRHWLQIAPGLIDCHVEAYIKPELVCPLPENTFRVLELIAPEDVRVVILGQDPYPTPGKASGIAFGYSRTYTGRIDSSMENILRELGMYSRVLRMNPAASRDYLSLENWVEQGVLLLNTRLSVQIGTPMSHANIAWKEQIRLILGHLNALHWTHLAWLNWGQEARNLCPVPEGARNRIDTTHPCKFSHNRGVHAFSGSGCFEAANYHLQSTGSKPINWIEKTTYNGGSNDHEDNSNNLHSSEVPCQR